MKTLVYLLPILVLGGSDAKGTDVGVVVTSLQSDKIPRADLLAMTDILVFEVDARVEMRVITPGDIAAQLGLEASKDALGCNDVACASEISGALGARYLLAGAARTLGTETIVSLSLIDTRSQEVRRAQSRVPKDPRLYGEAIHAAVADLFPANRKNPQSQKTEPRVRDRESLCRGTSGSISAYEREAFYTSKVLREMKPQEPDYDKVAARLLGVQSVLLCLIVKEAVGAPQYEEWHKVRGEFLTLGKWFLGAYPKNRDARLLRTLYEGFVGWNSPAKEKW